MELNMIGSGIALTLFSFAAAQGPEAYLFAENSSEYLNHQPGGALPAGLQPPSLAGFQDARIHPSRGGLSVCVSGLIPISAGARNLKLSLQMPTNQSQITDTLLEMITRGSSFMEQVAQSSRTQWVNGTWNIGATLCTPANNTKPMGVQMLTHGVGFDRRYWDFAPGYSYVDVASQFNWASFFYDRLGVGESSKPDGVDTVQAPLQAEIANVLATQLRQGRFASTNFSKVVGVGHSFGSVVTHAVADQYPNALDASVLTGFATNTSAIPTFLQSLGLAMASQDTPYRFSSLSSSYLCPGTPEAFQSAFFRSMEGQGFDPSMLSMAEASKGTVTLGELFTMLTPVKPALNYTKAAAVMLGQQDLPFCFGNCSYPTDHSAGSVKMMYPAAAALNNTGFFLAQTTGHAMNLHYRSTAASAFVGRVLHTFAKYNPGGVPMCKYLSTCQPAIISYQPGKDS